MKNNEEAKNKKTKKQKENKKVKDKPTKKIKSVKKDKTAKTEILEIKTENKIPEYYGHQKDADIWNSFLTNTMIAHRGLYDEESPENSLGAFEKAIKNGYAIELDVQSIEDGTPVVFHDSKMSRLTKKDKYIQNISPDELKDITLLNTTEKIPTLEEVLKFVNGRTPILVEIKHQQKIGELEKRIWDLLKNYKGEYAIQSFNPYTLQWFYNNAPKVWRGQLASYFKGENLSIFKKLALRRLGLTKVAHQNFVSYNIKNLPNRFVKRLEVPLLTWTIDSQEKYIKAIQFADNVIFEGFTPKI